MAVKCIQLNKVLIYTLTALLVIKNVLKTFEKNLVPYKKQYYRTEEKF
jgi:hypothetical protein